MWMGIPRDAQHNSSADDLERLADLKR